MLERLGPPTAKIWLLLILSGVLLLFPIGADAQLRGLTLDRPSDTQPEF